MKSKGKKRKRNDSNSEDDQYSKYCTIYMPKVDQSGLTILRTTEL